MKLVNLPGRMLAFESTYGGTGWVVLMKIVCDACGAKYFVSDDNVQKKVVRLTCQKCGHTIHARNQNPKGKAVGSAGVDQLRARLGLSKGLASQKKAAPAGKPLGPLAGLDLKAKPGLKPKPPSDSKKKVAVRKSWYYSKDGQSYGPFSEQVLIDQFGEGELGDECYVWHRDLGDWRPAFETEPFKGTIEARNAAAAADSATAEPFDKVGVVFDKEPHDATQITQRPTSERLESLRGKLGGGYGEIRSEISEDPPTTESAVVSSAGEPSGPKGRDAFTIDLDVDEASKVVSIHDIMAAAGRSPSTKSGDDEGEIDLDVDGASKVVGLEEFAAATSHTSSAAGDDGDSGSWLTEESDSARQNLFDAIDAARASGDLISGDGPVVEKSMLIHIEHLQSRNRKTKRYAVIGIITLTIFLVGFFILVAVSENEVVVEAESVEGTELVVAYGEEISDEDLERFAPESEFSLVVLGEDGNAEDSGEVETALVDPPIDGAGGAAVSPLADPDEIKPLVADGGEATMASATAVDPDVIKPLVGSTEGAVAKGSNKHSKKHKKNDSGLGAADLTAGLNLNPNVSGSQTSGKKRTDLTLSGGGSDVKVRGSTKTSGVSATSYTGSGVPGSRRKSLSISRTESSIKKQKKNNASSKLKGAARSPYVKGLKKVSRSVQECSKRQQRSGELALKKIYITVKIDATGKVTGIKYDKAIKGTEFEGCLIQKSNLWTFPASSEGKPVELRQGFVLD